MPASRRKAFLWKAKRRNRKTRWQCLCRLTFITCDFYNQGMMTSYKISFFLILTALVLAGTIPAFSANKTENSASSLPKQTSPRDLELIAVGEVVEVLKSDTLRIGKDKKIYKIDNIRIPLQMNMAARDFLEENLKGQTVGIYISGKDVEARKNELGHVLAHLLTQNGKWVQAEMVSRGLAYVASTPDSRDLVRTLYKYEELGRAQELGLWQYSTYAIKNSRNIRQYLNTFNIYEGTITSVQQNDYFAFLNFEENTPKNVTVVIKAADQFRFIYPNDPGLFKPFKLEKQRVRIRGWFEENDGPMLVITHPEQIEFLDIKDNLPIP